MNAIPSGDATLTAAFPGLPECMTLDEAGRRIAAALNAAQPMIERHVRERVAGELDTPAKPPVPASTGLDWPRVPLDESGPDYQQLVRIAAFTADMWALGPAARTVATRADVARGQIAEALALLLELGVIDIDRERLAAWTKAGVPMNRPPREGLA